MTTKKIIAGFLFSMAAFFLWMAYNATRPLTHEEWTVELGHFKTKYHIKSTDSLNPKTSNGIMTFYDGKVTITAVPYWKSHPDIILQRLNSRDQPEVIPVTPALVGHEY